MSIQILKVSTLVTIQDGGRSGYQAQGVPVSGPMDDEAFLWANLLVGNSRNAACFEIASGKLEILFNAATSIALTGGGIKATCDGLTIGLNKRIEVPAGSTLKCSPVRAGYWSYLGIAGGLKIESVMGSFSTYLPANFGGLYGRALRPGDCPELSINKNHQGIDNVGVNASNWGIAAHPDLSPIRLIKGPEFDRLSDHGRARMFDSFTISADSNRMGYRLIGNILTVTDSTELISTPVTRGTMQLANDGTPIVLMADAQTIGGYPRIAQVAAVDIPRLAQKRAGETVHFQFVSYDEACELFLEREQDWNKTETSIRLMLKYHAY